ncbi:DNA topoisomerase IB [Aliiglaciecola litoralis]|uniref:DNA topoisomerase n=1 Tax=Aliiglaciecola litoralis TaxID=582857 RepID=A0ABN1LIK5_9ALTE
MSDIKLIKSSDEHFTITRKKYGRGFQYFYLDGEKMSCKKQLARIKKLVIPPMWQDVRVCELPVGHIQATGIDLKRRKQYIYHDLWHQQRQAEKFAKLIEFASRLPQIRSQCLADLQSPGWPKNKVLALMVLILDETGIRIGNPKYTQRNQSYGLSTLRRKHVEVEDNSLSLKFTGKSSKSRHIEIDDDKLVKLITQASQQPGYTLFRFKDDQQKWQDVDSDEVNDYIQNIIGDDFTCKDFRTWTGTRLAYELLPESHAQKRQYPRRKLETILVKTVAKQLGNTPSVCRTYYIHPTLLAAISTQELTSVMVKDVPDMPIDDPSLSPSEQHILTLLTQYNGKQNA